MAFSSVVYYCYYYHRRFVSRAGGLPVRWPRSEARVSLECLPASLLNANPHRDVTGVLGSIACMYSGRLLRFFVDVHGGRIRSGVFFHVWLRHRGRARSLAGLFHTAGRMWDFPWKMYPHPK